MVSPTEYMKSVTLYKTSTRAFFFFFAISVYYFLLPAFRRKRIFFFFLWLNRFRFPGSFRDVWEINRFFFFFFFEYLFLKNVTGKRTLLKNKKTSFLYKYTNNGISALEHNCIKNKRQHVEITFGTDNYSRRNNYAPSTCWWLNEKKKFQNTKILWSKRWWIG